MSMYKKLSVFLGTFGLMLGLQYALPLHAGAEDVFRQACRQNPNSELCKSNRPQQPGNNQLYGPNGIITRVAQLLVTITAVASVIVIIIAGLQYMLATGDSAKINNAKNAILYALIGLVIAVLAQSIILFVLRRL
jgi:hypothetical protein